MKSALLVKQTQTMHDPSPLLRCQLKSKRDVGLSRDARSNNKVFAIARVARRRLGKGKVAVLGALGDDAEAARYRHAEQDNDDDDEEEEEEDDDDDVDAHCAQGSSYLRGFARPAFHFCWKTNGTMLVFAPTYFLNASTFFKFFKYAFFCKLFIGPR